MRIGTTTLVLCAMLCVKGTFAQLCVGNFTVVTDAQVAAFAAGCSAVTGDLRIGGSVTTLAPLSNLTLIGRDLIVEEANSLTSLAGMDLLDSIGRSIRIVNNAALQDLGSFASLSAKNLSRDLIVQDNPVLTDMSGLIGIEGVDRNLTIRNNALLPNLNGLNKIILVIGNVSIFGNAALTNTGALGGLLGIGGGLVIQNNASLTSLGFNSLGIVGNNLTIANNDLLPNLNGLSNLDFTVNTLTIRGNAILSSISGLSNLDGVLLNVDINNNDGLTSLNGLQGLTTIPGFLTINGNNVLTDITALENVTSIGGDLTINNNNLLVTIDGMENIASIGGNLALTNNNILSECYASCNVIYYVPGVGGSVTVSANAGSCNNATALQAFCTLALPIELVDFSANALRDHILLTWETATEINNAGFEVQRSGADGQDFQKIGWVAGAGNAQTSSFYSFKDFDVKVGQRYTYRLMQFDFDGTPTASPIVTASIKGNKLIVGAQYPNPVSAGKALQVPVYFPEATDLTLEVIDALGKIVFARQENLAEGNHLLTIDTDRLSTGVFRLRINANNGGDIIYSSFAVVE